MTVRPRHALFGLLVTFFSWSMAWSQPEASKPGGSSAAEKAKLADEQEDLAQQYKRFEAVLLRMAELTAASDPHRAAMLRQAVEQSKKRAINDRFDSLVKFLQENRLATAITNQEDLQKELASLMELLLSENRQERIASEQARVREYLKRVNKLIKDQKSIQGQSSGNADPKQLAPKQAKLADDTGKLSKEIKESEEGKSNPASGNQDAKPQDGAGKPMGGDENQKEQDGNKPGEKNAEQKPGEKKPGEKKPGEQKPVEQKQGEQKPGEQKPPEQGDNQKGQESKPQDGKPQPGKPQKGQQGQQGEQGEQGDNQQQQQQQQNQQSDEQNPARKRIQAAEERMRKAEEKLEQAKKKDAVEEQEQAIRELEQAKAELEKILRQLREEEIERMLAALEGRFRKMLQAQIEIYEGTLRLDKVPQDRRGRNEENEAGRLSRREADVALEAQKALTLLREEGSAVAMPEAVSQMHEDMLDVVTRLAALKVERRTQGLEEDIIAALEEMIESLQKAQKDMEDQKQKQQQQGQQQDKALIDQIAELKMIRSLQLRVNRRTQRYTEMIEGQEQAVEPDLVEAVQELGGREQRIFKATKDIVVGRNQ